MTLFVLQDEFDRDFEDLDDDPARHAAAIAAYCLVGQACAQRMTDGEITQKILRKSLQAWPKKMVSIATADLIAIDMWESVNGQLRFVDWDLTQFTKEQELRRREKAADRQRRKRQADKLAKQAVTRDVTRDVTGGVTVPSASTYPRERENSTWQAEGSGDQDLVAREDLSDPVSRELGLRYPDNDTQTRPTVTVLRGGAR